MIFQHRLSVSWFIDSDRPYSFNYYWSVICSDFHQIEIMKALMDLFCSVTREILVATLHTMCNVLFSSRCHYWKKKYETPGKVGYRKKNMVYVKNSKPRRILIVMTRTSLQKKPMPKWQKFCLSFCHCGVCKEAY